jgi:hypothetical protein
MERVAATLERDTVGRHPLRQAQGRLFVAEPAEGASVGVLVLDVPSGDGRHALPWASPVLADLVQSAEEEFALSLAKPQTPLRAGRPPAPQAASERAERARYSFD